MKKAVIVVAALLVIVAGAGLAAMPFAEDYAARRIRAGLAQGGIAVEGVQVSLLKRSIALDNLSGPNGDVKIGHWKAEGLAWPFAELKEGRLPLGGLGWGDPLKADRLRLEDVRIADPDEGGAWKIKEMVASELDLPRYDPVYDGPYRNQVLIARSLRALSVKRVEQTEIVHVTVDEAMMSARRVAVTDDVQGRIGKLDVEEIKLGDTGSPNPELAFGELRTSGIDLRRPLDLASSIDWEPGTPVGRIPVAFAQLSGFGGDLMTRFGLSLQRIISETVAESRDVSRSRLRVEGFVLAPSASSVEAMATRMVLQAMNLEAVRLRLDCSGIDDRARHEVRIDDCRIGGPDLADISFTARIIDTDEEFWEAIDFGDVDALLASRAALAAARLTIADKGLLERSLLAKAKLGGTSTATERAELAGEIRRFQPPGVLITQDMTRLFDTVARFIEQGGTLALDAAPQPALSLDKLDYLDKPGADLVNALGLTATLGR